ncbi:thioredoxin domain-containing protein [Acidianus manzaensis]|uniref:Thioredoxin domain-containing protein n=1 Tax=Acidianus manzaensis TaxID=282676 RepID=A0A1W6JXK4_9CREN|nr:thioredoxin domain-containing protein [Acidianus manzaensis]ARM74960.1 thioredoxin domain-containing protein [Acidianus manzaensis]
MNSLANSESEYLREASNQPINWFTWSDEAFAKAKKENKLILVDVGASWCHWCHVMDDETYSNIDIANIINNNFVAIKVDRDEMPEIDRKLQLLVSQISGESGWPLTVFMTPDAKVFFGGTFFPPEDSYGRIGFKKLLNEIIRLWNTEKEKILNASVSIDFKENLQVKSNSLNFNLIESAFSILTSAYDFEYGGLGNSMKFPHPKVDEFMRAYSYWTKDDIGEKLSQFTLKKMFYGGIFDQVGGGFHRYTVDREWKVPHFEKLLIDNAELLEDYYNAYLQSNDIEYLEAFNLTLDFLNRDLKNPDGYSNSIDADSEGIEGGYYTWTEDELKDALGDNFNLGIKIFNIPECEEVEGRKVLMLKDLNDLTKIVNKNKTELISYIRSLRKILLQYRQKNRKLPNIDKNTYSYPNYKLAEVLLFSKTNVQDALSIVNNINNNIITRRLKGGKEGILEDYATALLASIAAYEVTSSEKYYNMSIELGEKIMKDFLTADGFIESKDNKDLSVFDMPNESPNSLAIKGLLKLSNISDIKIDENIISKFSNLDPSSVSGILISAGSLIKGIAHIVIIDEKDGNAERLHDYSLKTYYPLKVVEKISDDVKDRLTSTLRSMITYGKGKSRAFICIGTTCSMPIYEGEKINSFLKSKEI